MVELSPSLTNQAALVVTHQLGFGDEGIRGPPLSIILMPMIPTNNDFIAQYYHGLSFLS
jgi:hypothetical protein